MVHFKEPVIINPQIKLVGQENNSFSFWLRFCAKAQHLIPCLNTSGYAARLGASSPPKSEGGLGASALASGELLLL